MPSPFIFYDKEQYQTGVGKYLYMPAVEHGHIVVATFIGCYSSSIASADTLQIGIATGTERRVLKSHYLPADMASLTIETPIHLPAGYRIWAYFDNIGAGETVELIVCGVRYTVEEYQKGV